VAIYSSIKSTFHGLTNKITMLSELVLLIMVIIIFYDVTMRYIFNNPTIWATELSQYSLAFITFIGLAELQKRRANINMDYFYAKFSPRVSLCVDVLNSLFVLIFSVIVTVEAYLLVTAAYRFNYESNSLLEVPLVIPYSLVLIGMFLLSLQSIIDIVESIRAGNNPRLTKSELNNCRKL